MMKPRALKLVAALPLLGAVAAIFLVSLIAVGQSQPATMRVTSSLVPVDAITVDKKTQ